MISFKLNKLLYIKNKKIIYLYKILKNKKFINIYILSSQKKILKYKYTFNKYIIECVFILIIKRILIKLLIYYNFLSIFTIFKKDFFFYVLHKEKYLLIYFIFFFLKINIIKKVQNDLLTKFINKIIFIKYSNFILKKYNNTYSSFIILDIDKFKKYNNTGHLQGDIILKEFSIILKEMLYKNIFISRFGGEEFIIYIIKKSLIEIFNISEIIRINIKNTNFNNNIYDVLTVSFGISNYSFLYSNINNNIFSLINKADIALYCAKKSGRNKVKILF